MTLLQRLQSIRMEIKRIPQFPEAIKSLPISDGRLADSLDNIDELSDLNSQECNLWHISEYSTPEPFDSRDFCVSDRGEAMADAVVEILYKMDGETLDYVCKEAGIEDWLLRSLMMRASQGQIEQILNEKENL